MQRLAQYGIPDAKINVLQEGWRMPWQWESERLALDQEAALIREVLIESSKKCWMYARTVFPKEILTGRYACLANLKDRPLGSVLFQDPDLQRSEFEYIQLQSGMLLCHQVIEAGVLSADLWTRRSVFSLHGKSLLLTEVFMSDIAYL